MSTNSPSANRSTPIVSPSLCSDSKPLNSTSFRLVEVFAFLKCPSAALLLFLADFSSNPSCNAS